MFSGKSEELIRRLRRARIARQKVQVFKPAIDVRYAEEHIVSKTGRLESELLGFGEVFSAIGKYFGEDREPIDIVGISRAEINANGWHRYPELVRLAQVAPLNMTEQAFLSRCKSIHEIWQRIPNAYLRNLLVHAGHSRAAIKELGSLKLLQALANVLERLSRDGESLDAFGAGAEPDDLTHRNESLAPLFVNNELRIADAHDAGETLSHLEKLGFDIASVNQGYGKALDHVLDGVISAFSHMKGQADAILNH